jgi:F0F1-type ATP synthase membrane subunit b/b'
VRGQIADLAIETARNIIIERMDQGAQAALVEKAISELRGKLH